MSRYAFIAVLLALLVTRGYADHRVALLFGNESPELNALAGALTRHGFRTTLFFDVDHKQHDQELERFIPSVPTRGTVLVYFRESGNAITDLLELLHTKSGANCQIVLVDGASGAPGQDKLPPGSLVGLGSGIAPRLTALLDNPCELIEAIESASLWSIKSLDAEARLSLAGSAVTSSPSELRPGASPGDEWVSTQGMIFCWCPMGKQEGGFWLAKYELTKRESCLFSPKGIASATAIASEKNHPMDMISAHAIDEFIETLNRVERDARRLPGGWEYCLPTEAEWEHACRAGTSLRFYFGDEKSELITHANFADRSLLGYSYTRTTLDDKTVLLAPVGTYRPNPWGLHDMYGNLWEVTESQGQERIARGGAWVSTPSECTSTSRLALTADKPRNFLGYRLAIKQKP